MAERDFSALGFRTTVIAKATLMITGEQALFAERFESEIRAGEKGTEVLSEGVLSRALPVGVLPVTMQAYVAAVEFEAPIDFGPVDF